MYESCICSEQLVRSWLFGTLSEEVLGLVHNLSTSRKIWVSLAENFNKSSLSREFSLRRNLQLISKKGRTLAEYSRDFKAICDSLSSIGKPVDESMKISGFLNGLSREYDPVTTVIQNTLSKFPPPTFYDVVSEVQAYDTKLKSYDESAAIATHQAFQMQQGGFTQNTPQYNPNCRGRGGRFNQQRGRGGYSSRGRGFVQHQSQTGGNSNRPTCQICGRPGHTAVKCYNRFDNSYNGVTNARAFSSLQVADQNGKEWFPYSGASAHVTASPTNLQAATTYNGNDTVMVADGTYLPITHVALSLSLTRQVKSILMTFLYVQRFRNPCFLSPNYVMIIIVVSILMHLKYV